MVTSEELFREARSKSAAAEVLRDKSHDDHFDGLESEANRKTEEAAQVSEEALALRRRAFSLLQETRICAWVLRALLYADFGDAHALEVYAYCLCATLGPGRPWYRELAPQAFYGLLRDLLPTPSECAISPDQRRIARRITEHHGGQIFHEGPSLELLCQAFAEASDLQGSVVPQRSDSDAAIAMVQIASQVGLDEVYQLQPKILEILEQWLGHKVTFTTSRLGESEPNIIGRVGPHTVLMVKLYSDRSVNARAALLRHYQKFLAAQDWMSTLLQRTCMPVLSLYIDDATLHVSGLAAIERAVFSEPWTDSLQLYLSNSPQHMLALARRMAAIRLTLDSLAAEQQDACSRDRPRQWPGRPWPLSQGKYESWRVQKLGNTIYLLQPPEEAAGSQSAGQPTAGSQPMPLVAKFWEPQGGRAVADLVQAAWHKQGVAPEVVDTFTAGSRRCTITKYLALEEGWAPLLWYANGDRDASAKLRPPPGFARVGDSDWEAIKVEALRALRKGHEAPVMVPPDMMPAGEERALTVHADARLVNTLARRGPSGWEVNFVDFARSGIQGYTRYPFLMSSDVRWPPGAQPYAHMTQQHEEDFLRDELEQGRALPE